MDGVWIKDARTRRFSDYPLALSDEWNKLWWMIGVQSGPINSEWLWEHPENEAFTQSALAFCAPCDFFEWVYRPSTLRTLAPHVVLDEWSYFCGFSASDEQHARGIEERFNRCGSLDGVLRAATGAVGIIIFDVDDGLLFAWSPHREWLEAFTCQSKQWETFDFPAHSLASVL